MLAYLNCPYCPSQAYLARDAEHSDIPPLEKYRCGSGKHVFYVEEEVTDDHSVHGRCV
jgi:hypothetical protein